VRFLIVAQGSYGDINPSVGIALGLKQRGHEVVFIASEYFEPLASRVGLELVSIMSRGDYLRITSHPDFAHPLKTWKLLGRELVLAGIRPVYHAIAERYEPGNTVVLAPSIALGARIAHDKLGVPFATMNVFPQWLRTVHEPLAMSPDVHRRLPPFARKAFRSLADWVIDKAISADTNAFRSQLGLEAVRPMRDQWLQSPRLIIGLFPPWFVTHQPDWPASVHLTGFSMFDGSSGEPLTPEVERFLAAGPPPIVVNVFSALQQSTGFFETSVAALRSINRRGILLTPFAGGVPKNLPPDMGFFGYVPHSALLRRTAGIIHQGGIGTCAQALAAGIPQLVVPFAFDQPFNARRLYGLGVSATLQLREYQSGRVARELDRLLSSESVKRNCAEYASLMNREDGDAAACDLIEQTFVATKRPSAQELRVV
jgi:rhamnosyltransferase subunit B